MVSSAQIHFTKTLIAISHGRSRDKTDEVMDSSALCEGKSCPSFFKNSCKGMELMFTKERCDRLDRNEELRGTSADAVSTNPLHNNSRWCIELRYMPIFTDKQLNDKVINNAETMPDKIAPKAYRNKQHGYRLWKEGYVSTVEVKPNFLANGRQQFLVKSLVAASMKSTKYVVYCHLNQETGDVAHAKCSCKAGLGGSCKHVAALPYTLLDYSNLGLSYIPENTTCTQVLQKWNIPGRKLNSNVIVKFSDICSLKSQIL